MEPMHVVLQEFKNSSVNYLQCTWSNPDLSKFLFAVFVTSKLMLLVFGVYLAWQVRDVQTEYNESRDIGVVVFITSLVALVILPIALVHRHGFKSDFIYRSFSIIFSSGTVLCWIFVSKILLLYKPRRDVRGPRELPDLIETVSDLSQSTDKETYNTALPAPHDSDLGGRRYARPEAKDECVAQAEQCIYCSSRSSGPSFRDIVPKEMATSPKSTYLQSVTPLEQSYMDTATVSFPQNYHRRQNK
jgi:hypothetical protein